MRRAIFASARHARIAALLAVIALVIPAALAATPVAEATRDEGVEATPMEVVRESNRRVQEILDAHEELDEEAEERVREIMNEATSFERLTEAAVEPHCDELPAAKCAELQETFAELLRVSSLRKLGRYRAESFRYLEEEIDGDTARVRTLARYEGDDFPLDYHLESVDGRWHIVNYIFDGVDTVRNYRKQFGRLLRRESVDDLIARLRARIADHEEME